VVILPLAELGVHTERPGDVRVPMRGEIAGGILAGPVEICATVAAGPVYATWEEYDDPGVGVGWSGIGSARAALRIPVGGVILRPLASVGIEHRAQQSTWEEDGVTQRDGARVGGGLDLVLPVATQSWLALGVDAGWSTLDAEVTGGVAVRVGTVFGR
jgi:hypothetical protein